MDLSEYAESLRRELTAITRFAGDDIARAAEMLSETLDSTVRLALLDVLSAAADEITASLDASKAVGAIGECFFDWNGTQPYQWTAIGNYAW